MSRIKIFFKYWVFISLLIFMLVKCDLSEDEKTKFVIHSLKIDPYNDLFATVYVSDTNWTKMAEFADSLVQGRFIHSEISFYVDSNNIPVINEIFSYYPYDIESIADYGMPNRSRIFEDKKEINESEDLSFKLFTYNNQIIEIDSSYCVDYRKVNTYIKYHNNYDNYDEQTQKTASRFIKLMLESNLDKLSNLFIGEIDKEQLQNIHELLLGTEWDNVRKSEGGSAEKYNLWYVQRSFVKDLDTLKVKIHFDVNKSAEKIERVEYSYLD